MHRVCGCAGSLSSDRTGIMPQLRRHAAADPASPHFVRSQREPPMLRGSSGMRPWLSGGRTWTTRGLAQHDTGSTHRLPESGPVPHHNNLIPSWTVRIGPSSERISPIRGASGTTALTLVNPIDPGFPKYGVLSALKASSRTCSLAASVFGRAKFLKSDRVRILLPRPVQDPHSRVSVVAEVRARGYVACHALECIRVEPQLASGIVEPAVSDAVRANAYEAAGIEVVSLRNRKRKAGTKREGLAWKTLPSTGVR
jgi:hypothetical protein